MEELRLFVREREDSPHLIQLNALRLDISRRSESNKPQLFARFHQFTLNDPISGAQFLTASSGVSDITIVVAFDSTVSYIDAWNKEFEESDLSNSWYEFGQAPSRSTPQGIAALAHQVCTFHFSFILG